MRLFIATVIAVVAASTALAMVGNGVVTAAAAQTPPAGGAEVTPPAGGAEVTLPAGGAEVTPPAGGAEARAKLLAADTNKDGRWSKAEWTAAGRRERGFDFLDADKDGLVSQAELKAGMAKVQARRGAN